MNSKSLPTSFVESGSVTDFEAFESFLATAYSDILTCDPRDFPVLLSTPVRPGIRYRSELAETVFETFNVPKLGLAEQPVLALYAHWEGRFSPTGVVVDAGHCGVSVVPVVDGYVVASGARRVPCGGAAVTALIAEALLAREEFRVGTPETAVSEISRSVKEQFGFVSQDPVRELMLFDERIHAKELMVKNDWILDVGCERFLAAESFFEPSLTGSNGLSIQAAVGQAVQSAPVDYRKELFGNILLCGGSAELPGFGKRLRAELRRGAARGKEVAVTQNLEISKYAAWVGGSVLAEKKGWNGWTTRAEYFEQGIDRLLGD